MISDFSNLKLWMCLKRTNKLYSRKWLAEIKCAKVKETNENIYSSLKAVCIIAEIVYHFDLPKWIWQSCLRSVDESSDTFLAIRLCCDRHGFFFVNAKWKICALVFGRTIGNGTTLMLNYNNMQMYYQGTFAASNQSV